MDDPYQFFQELEIALDHANKSNVDAQKNLKRYQDHVRDLQSQVEEEQRSTLEAREHASLAERRSQILQQEKEDLAVAYEQVRANIYHHCKQNFQSERVRRQVELEAVDAKDTAAALAASNASFSANKRKLEGDLQTLQAELQEAIAELKNSDDRARKAGQEAQKLSDDLRAEQEHSQNLDRSKKQAEAQIKDLTARLDEAEAGAMKGGKRAIAKLETKCRELESELDTEARRHAETGKNLRNKDRRCRELQFQVHATACLHDHLFLFSGR